MGIRDLIISALNLVNLMFPVMVAIALLVFLWGLAKFIYRVGGDEKSVEQGKNTMIWGVVTLFVMTAVWGLVAFLQQAFGLPPSSIINPESGRVHNFVWPSIVEPPPPLPPPPQTPPNLDQIDL